MVDFNNKEKLNVTKAVHEENATEYSYISGIIGLMVIFSVGLYIALTGIWNSLEKNQIALSVLFVCALVMFAVELLIRWLREGNFLHVSPLLKTGRYALFVAECLGYYILEFILLLLAILFFRVVSEYGYQQNSAYYQPWFSLLDILWKGYLAIGLPYLLLTRALQHHPKADEKEPAMLLLKVIKYLLQNIRVYNSKFHSPVAFTRTDKTVSLSLLVKIFFIPLIGSCQ